MFIPVTLSFFVRASITVGAFLIIVFIYTVVKNSNEMKRERAEKIEKDAMVQKEKEERAPQVELNRSTTEKLDNEDQRRISAYVKTYKHDYMFRIIRAGECNAYHIYDEPSYSDIGCEVSISPDTQYHEKNGKERDANVVTIGYQEVGEVSNSVYEKIDQFWDPFMILDSINYSGDKEVYKVALYDKRPWRIFRSYVAGTKYENRQDHIIKLKSGDYMTIKPTEYEGEPAAEIWSGYGMIGYIQKDLAPEIVRRVKDNTLRYVLVSNITECDKIKYIDLEISVYAQ